MGPGAPPATNAECAERATGIEPAWPAWKTAPNAWSGASTCDPSRHGAPPLTVVYRANSQHANSTPGVVDRELSSYRIRLIGQLVRPSLRHLRQWECATGLIRRNALAISPGFSLLPNVPRPPRDGPDADLVQWSLAR